MDMCVQYECCRCPKKLEKAYDPLKLELEDVLSHLAWVPGTELGSLEEQQALLSTEPSPAPT